MRSMFSKIDKNIFIIFISVTIMLSPLFLKGAILGHDSLTHMFRIVSLSQNIFNGNIFSKIGFNYINGFGYGTGIFYPQFNLYLSAFIYAIVKNVSIALKFYIYFNTLLSGIIMYQFLKRKVKVNSALVGSLIYILSPYCYVQSMFRGAIGEMTIFISLPLIFLGLDKIINREKYGNLLVILGGINILQSHIISTVYLCLFVSIFLILNYKKFIKKDIILDLLKCIILIILLSLYFIIPLIEHYNVGGYNILNSSGNPASAIVYLPQLFFHNGYNYGNVDGYKTNDEMSYVIGILIVILNICLPYSYEKLKKNNKNTDTLKYLSIGLISIFMMCCPFIWGHFKYLDIIQFPWRLLTFTVFFLSISGALIFNEFEINNKNFPGILALILIISFIQLNDYIVYTPRLEELDFDLNGITSNQVIADENTYLFKALGGANDYLPVEAKISYISSRGSELISYSGKILNIKDYKFKDGKLKTYIETEENTKIELPYIYYLGYDIKLNNKKVSYHKNKNGFIEITLKNHYSGNITVSYTGTTLDIIANYISIIFFVGVICYYLIYLKKTS